MRTQIAKTGYLPAEYMWGTFWLVTPSPFFRRSTRGLLSRKIFSDFIFFLNPLSTRSDYTSIFIFSDFRLDSCFDSVFQIILFNYFDSIKIRHLILDFIFQTLYCLNSHTSFRSIFTRLIFVIFSSYRFRLVSALFILRFIS